MQDRGQTIDFLVPMSGQGGVERVLNRLVGYLLRQNYRVRVVQMVYGGSPWLDADIPFYALRREKVEDISDFVPMYAQFMRETYVPKLVIATPWPYLTLVAREALAGLSQTCDIATRIIAWLHGPLEIYKKYGVGGAECLNFANQIWVLNQRTEKVIHGCLPEKSVVVVKNPVDFGDCAPVEPSADVPCALYVGRLSEEKGLPVILDAMARTVTDWRLRVIGDGEERRALEQQVEDLGIAERVELLGWQQHPWEVAGAADAFVMASEYEAFPLVAVEAMGRGLPVFSTPVDGVIELVRPGENGFLYPKGDSGELAKLLDWYAGGKLPRISQEACRASVEAYEDAGACRAFEQLIKNSFDKISVIIPCYNAKTLLPRCLESVFAQDIDLPLEVICVDDHSTDGTWEILLEWERRYPEQMVVVGLEENKKQGYARNLALTYATGNYVTYVDADDAVTPDCFRRLYETLREHDCEVSGCGYMICAGAQRASMPVLQEPKVFDFAHSVSDLQQYLMCCGWKVSPWGRLYRTEFLRKHEICFAEGRYMEDIIFSNRMLTHVGRYAHIPELLYEYYYNPNGSMAGKGLRNYFLDTAILANEAVEEQLTHPRYADCMDELAYVYFSKAFVEPVSHMWEDSSFFSYETFCHLREAVHRHFPDLANNPYLLNTENQEMKLAFQLYQADGCSKEELEHIFGVQKTEPLRCGVLELSGADFENAASKNEWIAKTDEPLLIFVNREVVSGEEVQKMLAEYPYMDDTRLLVLCSHAPETADWYGILSDLELTVYAMVICRDVFMECGSFNFRLDDETNREFLCRAAAVCTPVFLECSQVEWERTPTASVWLTNAYLLVRNIRRLKDAGRLEQAVEEYTNDAETEGKRQQFERALETLLAENRDAYERLYLATAPFLVIRGGDMCYGTLQTFADQLSMSLRRQGYAVLEVHGGGDWNENQMHMLETEHFRGVIGFQAKILFQEEFSFVKGNRFLFWFDHPMFFHGLFDRMKVPVTFLCQDGDHADYINRCCDCADAVQLPPAMNLPMETAAEKLYDLSFAGSYLDPQEMWDVINRKEGAVGELCRTCAQFLLEHVDMGCNELRAFLEEHYSEQIEQMGFQALAQEIWEASRIAPCTYRERVVRRILESGLELHVYGDSWNRFPVKEGERLVIHEAVAPELLSEEMSKSKISLNVMSWHKAGMTERIIDIMMAHSVCLTDETRYLKEHFSQMEDIVMFRLDELDELPAMIHTLLSDDALRKRITERAYEKVSKEHTWDARTEQLLRLVTEKEER